MKKFFEKYDLIKISGILVALSAILTWFIKPGYFSGSELVVEEEFTRIGLTNFYYYGLLGMYYFTVLVTFLFVLGGFYQLLSKQPGYQKLIKNISEKLKKYEIPVVLAVLLFFAIVGSLVNEYFPILVLIPFVIAILNRMKVDKISAFVSTFGGLLVGTIGSTYGAKVSSVVVETFAVEANAVLATQAILLIVSYVLLAIFTVIRLKKQNKKKDFVEYDMFACETKTSSKKAPKVWPYAISIALFAVVTVLAYLPWSTWNVTIFATATDWVNKLSIMKQPIISYVFGTFDKYGDWDIFGVQYMMLFATLLIRWFSHVSWDEIFDCYGEGFKKISKLVITLLVVYLILEFTVMYPVLPVIGNWIATRTSNFNAILSFVGAFVGSIFTVEMPYLVNLVGECYAALFAEASDVLAIIFQSAFGFASFFVPSSAILMLGLSYLDIKYVDWMKFIWKFLVALLAVIIVIILIMA